MLVERLLVEQLGFEQVGHFSNTSFVIVAIKAQVFCGQLNTTLSQEQLLIRFLYPIPGILHTNLKQLGIIFQLFYSFLVLNLAALNGVRAAPPVGDGYADGGKNHTKRVIVIQQIMIVVTCTHGNGCKIPLSLPLSELPGVHALHAVEETGEGGDFSEMELVGDLGDA